MDKDLRTSIWNLIQVELWDPAAPDDFFEALGNEDAHLFCKFLWEFFFKWPLDEIPEFPSEAFAQLKSTYFDMPWYQVYDLIEFLVGRLPEGLRRQEFVSECNAIFEREMSGYRFIGGQLAPIVDDQELEAIDEAASSSYHPVRSHIAQATQLLSDRQNPDYRNSIKESISAVEAACKIVAGNETADLGKALALIDKASPLHRAFRDALNKLYAYTSGQDGIRHAIMEEKNIDFAEAKFMLVACAAFCNFLLQRSSEIANTS